LEPLREPGEHVSALAGSGLFSVCRRSALCANRRRAAHAVGTQQVPNHTELSALFPLAFTVTKLDFEYRIDNTADRRNADAIVETTKQSVWRVSRIVLCFGLRAPAECAERNYSGCISSLSQSKPLRARRIFAGFPYFRS
jgi:hypothetical protein